MERSHTRGVSSEMARWLVAICVCGALGCSCNGSQEVIGLPRRRLAPDAAPKAEVQRSFVPVGTATVIGRAPRIDPKVTRAVDESYVYELERHGHGHFQDFVARDVIVRIDRETGKRRTLTDPVYRLTSIAVFRGEIYAGFVEGDFGTKAGVFRVSCDGGPQELIWEGPPPDTFTTYDDGLLGVSELSVEWIQSNHPAVEVYRARGIDSAVVDGNSVYIADTGGDGPVERVSLATGERTRLVTTGYWPIRITTYGDEVFFGIDRTDEIWSAPKTGGPPHLVFSSGRRDDAPSLLALWGGERGLYWIRDDGDNETLSVLAW